jgi:hypothetical protein
MAVIQASSEPKVDPFKIDAAHPKRNKPEQPVHVSSRE